MEWQDFLAKAGKSPIIEAEAFYTGSARRASVEVQLSRWQKAGKLLKLKRGLYVLAELYRKTEAYGPYTATCLHRPSYVSLEKALEFYNFIPERVNRYTSITTNRPAVYSTALGVFEYAHIQQAFFWGYMPVVLGGQTGFMALPEKALLDFFYLRRVPVTEAYIDELRLQNLADLDEKRLKVFAAKMNKSKLVQAADALIGRIIAEKKSVRKK